MTPFQNEWEPTEKLSQMATEDGNDLNIARSLTHISQSELALALLVLAPHPLPAQLAQLAQLPQQALHPHQAHLAHLAQLDASGAPAAPAVPAVPAVPVAIDAWGELSETSCLEACLEAWCLVFFCALNYTKEMHGHT